MTAHVPCQTDESPCDACALQVVCTTHYLACEAFVAFTNGRPWADIVRMPNALIYKRMYRLRTPQEYEKLEQQLAKLRERKKQTLAERGRRPGRKPKVIEVVCE